MNKKRKEKKNIKNKKKQKKNKNKKKIKKKQKKNTYNGVIPFVSLLIAGLIHPGGRSSNISTAKTCLPSPLTLSVPSLAANPKAVYPYNVSTSIAISSSSTNCNTEKKKIRKKKKNC